MHSISSKTPPTHPGYVLRELVAETDAKSFARTTHVPLKVMQAIFAEEHPVTQAIADAIERATGTSARLLVAMQQTRDMWLDIHPEYPRRRAANE